MMRPFAEWLKWRWQRPDAALLHSYHATFVSPHGQRVLQHLLDSVYCTVYEGTDPLALAAHNARRAVVQEILQNMDLAENPGKYAVEVDTHAVV